MNATPGEIETKLTALAETPSFIADVSGGLKEVELRLSPAPGEWSMTELLAHLHACAEIWGDDIARMLTRDEPTFTKPHPRQVMKETRFLTTSFADSIAAFTSLRELLLNELRSLEDEQWERGATINQRRRTVFTQMRRMALHESIHRDQFRELKAFHAADRMG